MDQFKHLPEDQKFPYAWAYLTGYLERAYESDVVRGIPRKQLRSLLDRMHALAGTAPLHPTQADPEARLGDLPGLPACVDYKFSFLLLTGFLEAAYHYGREGLDRRRIKEVLDRMQHYGKPSEVYWFEFVSRTPFDQLPATGVTYCGQAAYYAGSAAATVLVEAGYTYVVGPPTTPFHELPVPPTQQKNEVQTVEVFEQLMKHLGTNDRAHLYRPDYTN